MNNYLSWSKPTKWKNISFLYKFSLDVNRFSGWLLPFMVGDPNFRVIMYLLLLCFSNSIVHQTSCWWMEYIRYCFWEICSLCGETRLVVIPFREIHVTEPKRRNPFHKFLVEAVKCTISMVRKIPKWKEIVTNLDYCMAITLKCE